MKYCLLGNNEALPISGEKLHALYDPERKHLILYSPGAREIALSPEAFQNLETFAEQIGWRPE